MKISINTEWVSWMGWVAELRLVDRFLMYISRWVDRF